MRIEVSATRRFGERGALLETTEPLALAAALRAVASADVEVVPGAATVLVRFPTAGPDPLGAADRLVARIGPTAGAEPAVPVEQVRIPVRYDGADLAVVAGLTGLTTAEVVARHCAPDYTVAFCGFAPGFGYLTGLDPVLMVPRRPEPRTVVPAGAVAVADRFSAVYPRASPGGWRLLGHTDVVLWDLGRDPPARLRPGTRVRFEAT